MVDAYVLNTILFAILSQFSELILTIMVFGFLAQNDQVTILVTYGACK